MRINELIGIIQGTLLNDPPLSYFENFTTNLAKVVRGTLFIATTQEDAQEAIALGAYGIVFEDGEIGMIDNEIAWIKVDSLQDSITRFIRYQLLSQQIRLVYLSLIEFEIAEQITQDSEVGFLRGGYADFLELTQTPVSKIITNDKLFLELSFDYTESISPSVQPFRVISYTLFDTKIYFNSERYTIGLPSLFLDSLSCVIEVLQTEEIEFRLENFESITPLKPNFISSQGTLCKYGQSGRVVIAEQNFEAFKQYATYITLNAKWAKILFFVPEEYFEIFEQIAPTMSYKNPQELLELYKTQNYNFGLTLGINQDFLTTHLQPTQTQTNLFDFAND